MRPTGYRSPAWDFSERTASLLEDYGFPYDSSLMEDDFTPCYVRTGDKAPANETDGFGTHLDVVELPVT